MISADGEWVNSHVLPFVREQLCSIPTLTRTIMTVTATAMITPTAIIMATRPTSAASGSQPC